ncbi:hypothetical protein BDV59DRAFT_178493 [Aspergillus ambiguus]|uniref:NAD(P)/FAD-dependent oxidoreductase n=1 Tax=Aspergillus ambiguus TaxID=176160 RepID=UPI003CCC9D93
MEPRTQIVIIGASFAGISTAHAVLKNIDSVKVILINPTPTFYFPVAAPRVLAKPEAFHPDQYLIPISPGFKKYTSDSFELINGHATSIDIAAKAVWIDSKRTVSFDYLVIASGSTTAATKPSNDMQIPFKQTGQDNVQSLIESTQRAIAEAKSIVIAGAGPIGVELAGEIAEAAAQDDREVTITLVSATDRVLPVLKLSGSQAAESILEHLGVKIIKPRKVTRAILSKGTNKWSIAFDNGDMMETDLYIPTTGVYPNNEFIPQDLLDKDGWLKVDGELRVQGGKNDVLPIYGAGDITNNWMRLGYKAAEQAPIVAANLKSDIMSWPERRTYNQGTSINMVVPIGASGGTGQVFGFTPWSILVWLVKGRDFFISKARSMIGAD